MVGETNVAGARLRSVIAVTYPEGSVCTCSNGTKTLKAKDTSGKALFNVPVGEWTVSATDGSQTTSNTVSITAEGQIINVELKYIAWLYKDGDEFVNVTGGWVMCGGGSIVKNTDCIAISAIPWGANGWASTANMINLTDISTIKFDVYSGSTYPRPGYPTIAITTNTSGIDFGGGTGMTSSLTLAAGRTIRSIDVSSLSGSYYVIFGGRTGDDGAPNIAVYKVWGVPK